MAVDKYLVVKASGGGGLGDCIKSLLVAILYAKQSGRILVVDWSGGVYSESGKDPYPLFFSLHGIPEAGAIPDTDDVYPVRWRGRLNQSLHEVYTQDGWTTWERARTIKEYSADLAKLDYTETVIVVWDFDQFDKLTKALSMPSQPAIKRYKQIAQQHLSFTSDLEKIMLEALESTANPVLGVHIRATREFQENKGAVGLDGYIAAVEKTGFGKQSIFLATDNSTVEAKFINRFPSTSTIMKWFSKPGDSLHLNTDCPDKIDGLRAALLDILLLGRCPNLLITPGSSFSELAQILSDREQRIMLPGKMSGGWPRWQQIKQIWRNKL